jgi:hypothetical protein
VEQLRRVPGLLEPEGEERGVASASAGREIFKAWLSRALGRAE